MLVNERCIVQGWYGNRVNGNRFVFFTELVYNSNESRYVGDHGSNHQPYWNIICKIKEVKRV